MRVLVSSCGRFHANNAAFQLYQNDALGLYISTYRERRLPPSKTRHIRFIDTLHRGLQRIHFVNKTVPLNLIKKQFFDDLVSRCVEESDLVHLFSALQPKTIQRAHQLGIPAIVDRGTAHPVYQNQILTEEFSRFAPHLLPVYRPGVVERQVEEFEMADYVIVVSTYVRDTFIEQGFPDDKIICIPLGVDLSNFYPVDKKDDVFRILTVGLPSFQKGTHYLLEAFGELDPFNSDLQIVGAPRPEMSPMLARYEGRITHIHGIPHDHLYRTYSNASVFVLPSLNDGFPHVVLEAMACGVPVIISENVGVRDVVRDGVDGFVIPIRNVVALQERLMTLRENPDLCRQMGKAARQRAVQFTWKRYGDRLVRDYERLLNAKG